ncbi:hypothetical protein PLCT1_00674 [Planctomycetaceae bacterium]|nr:hypothetical protein PLCT1_00674 [Planctomycetaceae bacterium]
MSWLSDLLKHLSVSRSIAGAVFLTALVLAIGPRFLPQYVEPVPKEWSSVVVAALVFSGSLLLFWSVAGMWNLITRGTKRASAFLDARVLSPREQEALLALAAKPSTSLNLEHIDYERTPFSELELLEIMQNLERKGLVQMNQFSDNLVSLSPTGRARALAIQRQASSESAP